MTDELTSVPVKVTLFEDRAEVQRRVTCEVTEGVSWVRVAGVTVALDDTSLVVGALRGSARVIAARVLRRLREVPALSDTERAEAERARDDAVRAEWEALAGVERAKGGLARCVSLESQWVSAVAEVHRGSSSDPGAGATAWGAAFERLRAATAGALDAVSEREAAREETTRERGRAEARCSLATVRHLRYEAVVEVQVEATSSGSTELEITYRTPCALWRPDHVARLIAKDGGAHALELETWATAWQATGEFWEGVSLRLSTARPARSAAAPKVTDDVLVLRKKTDWEQRSVVVATREQAIQLAGIDRGTRDVDEMPGVDDGGEPQWFDAEERVDFRSDGQPLRVRLRSVGLGCVLERVAYPERSDAVHLRATATLAGESPLLAGPVRLARGTEMIGRSRTNFVGRGEVFELGFGVDDGLRVRRAVEEKRDTTAVTGTQKITRTVKLFVSNVSGTSRKATFCERLPVSEIDDVEIALLQAGGARFDPADGFARWEIEVPPRGVETVSLQYRIEAGSKVVLPF